MNQSGLVKKFTEPEYRALPYISYSALAGLDKNPANLLNTTFSVTKSLIYGSVVDCLLFDGVEEFEKKYAVLDHIGPTDTVKDVVDKVYEKYLDTKDSFLFNKDATLKDLSESVLIVARELEYGAKNWKDETIINKIITEGGKDYFDFLKENLDKTAIDNWMYDRANTSIAVLRTHPFSRDYIIPKHKHIEIHYQFPIIWKYNGVMCKSLLDILYIDHSTKTIIPIDLKTTFDDVIEFPKNYIKWKYYIQAAFYTKAISYLKLEYPALFNYKVDFFRFMVISSNDSTRPLIWLTDDKDLLAGELGGTLKNGEVVTGFNQLIEDIQWHRNNEKYEYPAKAYKQNGHLELNVF